MPKLTELDAEFLRAGEDGNVLHSVAFLHDAQGIWFECPLPNCKYGKHRILVWFADRGTPDYCEPTPRWKAAGSSMYELSLTPSINCDVNGSGDWHGFVTNGEAK